MVHSDECVSHEVVPTLARGLREGVFHEIPYPYQAIDH